MPEGPEVRKIADVLEKAVGKYLTEFHIVPDSKYKFYRDGIPGCKMLTAELDRGHSYLVEKIIVKGKLIRIDLKNDLVTGACGRAVRGGVTCRPTHPKSDGWVGMTPRGGVGSLKAGTVAGSLLIPDLRRRREAGWPPALR